MADTKATPEAKAKTEAKAKPAPKPKEKTVVKFAPGKVKVDDAVKLPPQAKVIIDEITAAGKPIERDELVKRFGPKITTKQPPERVLGYYKRSLEEAGYITVTKEKVAAA